MQVFRRADSIYESARLKLRGLEPEAVYEVTDLDSRETTPVSGRALTEDGLPVKVAAPASAVVMQYARR